MFSIHHLPYLNVGIYPIHILFGFVVAIIAFFVVVAIEGRIMNDYFRGLDKYDLPYKIRFRYSLIINTISTIIGIVINYFLFREYFREHLFQAFFINYLFTLIIEYLSVKLFIRTNVRIRRLAGYIILSNLVSYFLMIGISIASPVFRLLLWMI